MISAEDLGGLLFGIHSHAMIENEENPQKVVYAEEDVIKLLKKLGFPEPKWGKSINIDEYEVFAPSANPSKVLDKYQDNIIEGDLQALIQKYPGDGEKPLKTLEEHQKEKRDRRMELDMRKPKPNGIACPKCGKELLDSNPSITLMSLPPKKHIHCANCGYSSHRIA